MAKKKTDAAEVTETEEIEMTEEAPAEQPEEIDEEAYAVAEESAATDIEIEEPDSSDEPLEPVVLEEAQTSPAQPAANGSIFRPGIEGVTAARTTRAQRDAAALDRDMTLDAIQNAIHNGQILVNTATAAFPLRLSGQEVYCLSFEYASGIRVIIPYNKVFEDAPNGTLGDASRMSRTEAHDMLIRQRTVLAGMLGGPIRWIPTQIVPDDTGNEYTVVGSRVMALREDRERLYFGSNPTFRDKHTYYATVVCVLSHMAIINLGGVEKMIPQTSLTYQYAKDLRDIFKPGDEVYVVLKELRCDTKTGDVDCLFDCLSGELVDAQPQIKKLMTGTITSAVISRIVPLKDRDTGTPGTLLLGWIESPGIPCKCNSGYRSLNGVPIGPGVRCTVKVQSIGRDGCPRVVINRVSGKID